MKTKLGQFGVNVEVDEGAVFGGNDARLQDFGVFGDGDALADTVILSLDICGRRNIKDVDLAVDTGGTVDAAAAKVGVTGENEELVITSPLDLGLSGGTRIVLGGTSGLYHIIVSISLN